MKNSDYKFWPYKPKYSIIIAIIIAIVFFVISGILRSTVGWPPDESSNTILVGILLLSLLPVLLAILDVIVSRGGSIGFKDFKIDFSKVQQLGFSGFTVPPNIGVPGVAVSDSGTGNILETLRKATSTGVVVVDLEDGHAWWETRLLVLVSGAKRLQRPDKIVFVANAEGKDKVFQGWAEPEGLLQQLLKENQQYQKSFHAAQSSAKQWELMPPLEKQAPNNFYQIPQPPLPVWIQGPLAMNHIWMTFSIDTGIPNELLAEQFLQHDLGENIEQGDGSKHISSVRLNELFKPVMVKQAIDTRWSNDNQTTTFFTSDASFIAITENGKYVALVSRQTLLNEALKGVFIKIE